MDYNRLVKDLNGLNKESFLNSIKENFELSEQGAAFSLTHPHHFGMYLDGTWYKLKAKDGTYTQDL